MTDAVDLVMRLLGRDRAWRLGRALYMRARGEKATNAIALNGEAALIRRAIAAAEGESRVVLLDVGANLGEWSDAALQAARDQGRDIDLHVLEPTPKAAQRLEDRFRSDAHVAVHRVALSAISGSARFAVFGDTAGTNSLEFGPSAGAAEAIEVRTLTGSDFAAGMAIGAIDLVKVDTEGHDCSVLRGFEPLLAERRIGAIQFEYNSHWLVAHNTLQDVFAIAERTGYRLGRVVAGGIEFIDCWNPECDRYFEDNFALVRPDKAAALGGIDMHWSGSNTLIRG